MEPTRVANIFRNANRIRGRFFFTKIPFSRKLFDYTFYGNETTMKCNYVSITLRERIEIDDLSIKEQTSDKRNNILTDVQPYLGVYSRKSLF